MFPVSTYKRQGRWAFGYRGKYVTQQVAKSFLAATQIAYCDCVYHSEFKDNEMFHYSSFSMRHLPMLKLNYRQVQNMQINAALYLLIHNEMFCLNASSKCP